MSAGRTILIVGASGRAAAASAIRAGLRPFVIDLFADEDTIQMCPVSKCPLEDYPHGFIGLAEHAPPGPWMYTGGLENHPEVVAAISESRELWGNGPEVLAKIRDPFALAKLVPMPAMRRMGEALDPAKRWLCKPYRSSGGFGIEPIPLAGRASDGQKVIVGESCPSLARPANGIDDYYAQEYLEGSPYSALFLGGELFGVCSQLIGEPWLDAPPFRYCGNIGPLPVDNSLTVELQRIGAALQPLGLRGLIGVDFMLPGNGVRVLEVNPRYTASAELYERALSHSLLRETSPPDPLSDAERGDRKIHGKAILYADRTFAVPANHPWRGRDFADIPTAGSVIPEGRPVVTLFASADTESECLERLMEVAKASAPP